MAGTKGMQKLFGQQSQSLKKFLKSKNIKQYLPTKQHLDRRDRMLYKLDSRRLGTVI